MSQNMPSFSTSKCSLLRRVRMCVMEEILHIVEIEDRYIRNDGRTYVRQIYIYKRKISIDITCVGLASARPNYALTIVPSWRMVCTALSWCTLSDRQTHSTGKPRALYTPYVHVPRMHIPCTASASYTDMRAMACSEVPVADLYPHNLLLGCAHGLLLAMVANKRALL